MLETGLHVDDSFDVVICNHVLEHIRDDGKAMRELCRVLKSGGFAILQVPISYKIDQTFEDPSITSPDEQEKVFGQSDHLRIYGCDYTTRLEEAGFSVKELDFQTELGAEEVEKYRLFKGEKLYVCGKA